MISKAAQAEAKELHRNWLYKLSGAAAVAAGGLLLAGAIEVALAALQWDGIRRWLSGFQNNWLAVIFKLHAGFEGVQPDLLSRLNLLDILILALVATTYIGLYTGLRRISQVWSLIAFVQPLLGLVLFAVTKSAGRSSVMGAELVISVITLRSKFFEKRIAYMGMLSGILLLAGDLGASLAPSAILAILTAVGYLLLLVWLFLIGLNLFQVGQDGWRE